ncbi:MAG: sigma 54-interacting transcriptional regulator [bacterium]|nr:sigma 54-interacting transcriptional regulator [bacterium]
MDKTKLLADTPLFHKLKPDELALIASVTEELVVKKGGYVYRQGEMGHAFYVIVQGKVDLIVNYDDGGTSTVGHLSAGNHFGEISLLTGSPRSRSVKASEDLILLSLEKIAFDEILLENPRIHRLLDEALAERLREASKNRTETAHRAEESDQADLKKKEIELSFLNKLNALASTDLSFEDIKEKITELVLNNFNADLCELYLGTPERLKESAYCGGIDQSKQATRKEYLKGSSPIYEVMRSKKIIYLNNAALKEFDNNYIKYNAALVVPLICTGDNDPFGALSIYALEADIFSPESKKLFSFFAPHIAQLLKNMQFYQEARRQRDELEALSQIGKELNASYDLPRLLYKIVSLTASLMKVEGVILRLKDEQEGILHIKSYYGITDEVAHTVTQKIGEGVAGKVAEEGKPIISNDVAKNPLFAHNIPGEIRSVLCVPLFMKGNVIGTMSVYDKKADEEWHPFTDDDQRLLDTIASQASIAIENARIFSDRTAKISAKGDLIKAGDFVGESHQANQMRAAIAEFSANLRPVLLTGEAGTGKRLVAKQIHLESPNLDGPYIEVDARRFDPRLWGGELFGYEKDSFSFAPVRRLGYMEQFKGGTIALSHIEDLEKSVQLKLLEAIKTGHFQSLGGKRKILLAVRFIFLIDGDVKFLVNSGNFNRDFYNLLAEQSFELPPLRSRKRDIPALAQNFLKQFGKKNFKEIKNIAPDALGVLMNYDWPGNLTEMSNVIERAVILSDTGEILSEQILLGLPRTEGKLGYNLLRFDKVRQFFSSSYFPILPKIIISVIFYIGILSLFFGPKSAKYNIGLTIVWVYGWTFLFFSNFFLARIWCSICSLSLPGLLAQKLLRPKRKAPRFIVQHSGWIMTVLCILVLWLELVWNAYEHPQFMGIILLLIILGSLVFSMFYERGVWCRYLCSLGAVNAIFSMSSLVELRANRDLCTNRCRTHACFKGTDMSNGCPMYDHPFMIDNNRDCTLCGNCIKNCENQSIQLNLRVVPDELWSMRNFRLADSFLILSLGTAFFFYVYYFAFHNFVHKIHAQYSSLSKLPEKLITNLLFFSAIIILWLVYNLLCYLQSKRVRVSFAENRAAISYGLVPLIRGGFMAHYLEVFASGALLIFSGILFLFGIKKDFSDLRVLSSGATASLQTIIVFLSLCLSLLVTFKIVERLKGNKDKVFYDALLPLGFVFVFGVIILFVV